MRRGSKIIIMLVCALAVVSLTIGLNARDGRERIVRSSPPTPQVRLSPPTSQKAVCESQPTHVQIDLFEMNCTNEQLARMDIDKITGSEASTYEILTRLSEMGEARLLVRVDNTVDLTSHSRLTNGKRMPSVRDITISGKGVTTPSVTYEEVGFITNLVGQWDDDNDPQLADITCEIKCSNIVKSGVTVTSGVTLPSFTKLDIEQRISVESGKPTFIISNDMPAPDDQQGHTAVKILRFVATRLSNPNHVILE